MKNCYGRGQDVWQEEKMKEIEMQQRRIEKADRRKVTNVLLLLVKIVR